MMTTADTPLYEGKAKKLFATADPAVLRQEFKDSLTAFDAVKKGSFEGKGAANCTLATHVFRYLETHGIPTHFIESTDERTMLVRRLTMLPVEVVVRNVAAGSLVKKYERTEGEAFNPPIVEFYLKNDALHDPLINVDHILAFGLIDSQARIAEVYERALQVNVALRSLFAQGGITLVDFKLEFGLDAAGQLFLGDEVSPDTCRLWETTTGEKLDKDRFRFDLGDVGTGYRRVLELLGIRGI